MSLESDRIDIEGLRVRAIVGVLDHERHTRQDLVLYLALFTDTRQPGRTDAIQDAIDYSQVAAQAVEFVEGSSFFLLERLADALSGYLLEEFAVDGIRLRIEKPGALSTADTVALTISRERS